MSRYLDYTTDDAVKDVLVLLQTHSADLAISGVIQEYTRPVDSDKEDIVVNAIDIDAALLQWCTVNIDIHVPDLSRTTNGKIDYKPNSARLNALTKIVKQIVDGIQISDHWFAYISFIAGPLQQTEIHHSYMNVRLELKQTTKTY